MVNNFGISLNDSYPRKTDATTDRHELNNSFLLIIRIKTSFQKVISI